MKLTPALFLLLLLTNLALADTFRLRNGATVTGTIKRGGSGQVILETSDGVVTHKLIDFDDATRARLERYNEATPSPMATSVPQATARPIAPSPAVEREKPAAKNEPVHIRKLPQTPEEMDALMRDLQGPRKFVYYGGVALMLFGGLWFVIRTFQQSIWWGLGCLICGLPSLVFLFLHWEKARDPFLMQLAGVAMMLGALFVMS